MKLRALFFREIDYILKVFQTEKEIFFLILGLTGLELIKLYVDGLGDDAAKSVV